jgi:hypothetical protein
LGHIIVSVLGMRASNHFGCRSIDYQSFDYAGTAAGALGHSMRYTPREPKAYARSTVPVWRVRAARMREPSPITRWPC